VYVVHSQRFSKYFFNLKEQLSLCVSALLSGGSLAWPTHVFCTTVYTIIPGYNVGSLSRDQAMDTAHCGGLETTPNVRLPWLNTTCRAAPSTHYYLLTRVATVLVSASFILKRDYSTMNIYNFKRIFAYF